MYIFHVFTTKDYYIFVLSLSWKSELG